MTYIADVQCTMTYRKKLVVDVSAYHEPTFEEVVKELRKDKYLTNMDNWEPKEQVFEVVFLKLQEPDIVVYPE